MQEKLLPHSDNAVVLLAKNNGEGMIAVGTNVNILLVDLGIHSLLETA